MAILPGFPRPLVEGILYEALRATTASHGQDLPIYADQKGLVWAGRTMLNICMELGIEPRIEVVSDGHAAAVTELATRILSVLETADLVAAVHGSLSAKFALREEKRSHQVSTWFRSHLGRDRGFSPRQIETYLRVARATPNQRNQMAHARTLHSAIRMLTRPKMASPTTSRNAPRLDELLTSLVSLLSTGNPIDPMTIPLLQGVRALIDESIGLPNNDTNDQRRPSSCRSRSSVS